MESTQALIAFAVTFTSVFLRGFQYKNVIHGRRKTMFVTSYLMSTCEVLVVGTIVRNSWLISIPCGLGAAFGMLASVTIHDRLFSEGKR
jgi:hypothetical protein